MENIKKYTNFYESTIGKAIARAEANYIYSCLKDCKKILSVGCGPAAVEGLIKKMCQGVMLVGLDISKEMLSFAPSSIISVVGNAENMPFKNECFDAVMFLASLEFIDDYSKAIEETHRVLKSRGMLLILMLNPQSQYFRAKYRDKNSYIRRNIRHINTKEIKDFISRYFFSKKEEYFLGITDRRLSDITIPTVSSIYILQGVKYDE